MYYSITFEHTSGSKNTWDDWFLIPSSRPVFNPPSPNYVFVDILGSAPLDISDTLTGEVVLSNRTGSLEFYVDNGHMKWNELYSYIMDFLHGKTLKAYLEDDPTYYYEGRFAVNEWLSEPHHSKIVIDYNLGPYKMEKYSSLEAWKWDEFNFETGVIRDYSNLTVDGSLTVTIPGTRMTVIPTFIVEGDDIYVEFENRTYKLTSGTSRVANIVITEGEHTLKFTGNGKVSINYRGGRL